LLGSYLLGKSCGFSYGSFLFAILVLARATILTQKRWQTFEKNKMKIIPSDKIEIVTTLSNQEVRKIMAENIRPKKGLEIGFNKPQKKELFEGFFEQDEFEIQRIITGRNSFLPQIKGQIQPNINGTKLVADLKVHPFVIVFMLFWLTFVGFAFVLGIIGVINQGTNPFLLIFPLIMIGFGIGLVNYGFNSQKDKSISDLKRIINGQIKEKRWQLYENKN